MKRLLVVLDFDGLLINSYELLRTSFAAFDLDVGDEDRFRNRRKFLKYVGGGKELLKNLSTIALPKTKHIRAALTANYRESGRVFEAFVPLLNGLIASPAVHVGIVSRNYTRSPGQTIREVLRNSGIHESDLDFVIPIPVGVKKYEVLAAMNASRYRDSLFAGDEIGDYNAAQQAGYTVLMASYGFDHRKRLERQAGVPPEQIFETPEALAEGLSDLARKYLPN